MNVHAEIARLRDDRDDALEQVRCLTEVIAEMAGHDQVNLPGFTKSESRVIRCLMAANGRVVSYEGIMQAVYFDCTGDWPEAKTIKFFICHIRAKIAGHPRRILTSRSEGYWLEADDG